MMFPGKPEYVCEAAAGKLPPKRREDYVRKLYESLDEGIPQRGEIDGARSEQPARISLRE